MTVSPTATERGLADRTRVPRAAPWHLMAGLLAADGLVPCAHRLGCTWVGLAHHVSLPHGGDDALDPSDAPRWRRQVREGNPKAKRSSADGARGDVCARVPGHRRGARILTVPT